ncbi:DNA adenine methylase, partial [Campylobacter coli]|nr:DNA adenine methylase [Campylobacter coli]
MLKNIKGKFMLSYNDCELIRELYKDFNIKE